MVLGWIGVGAAGVTGRGLDVPSALRPLLHPCTVLLRQGVSAVFCDLSPAPSRVRAGWWSRHLQNCRDVAERGAPMGIGRERPVGLRRAGRCLHLSDEGDRKAEMTVGLGAWSLGDSVSQQQEQESPQKSLTSGENHQADLGRAKCGVPGRLHKQPVSLFRF